MPYNSNIPLATDKLSVSQGEILANFQALAPFGDGYANLADLTTAPSWTSDNNGIYNLNNSAAATGNTGVTELFVHRQTADNLQDVPITASKMSNTTITSCDNGWGYLSNGMLIKWGKHPTASSGSFETVNVDTLSGGPPFQRALQATLTADGSGNTAANVANFSVIMDGFVSTTTGNIRILPRNAITSTSGGKFQTNVRYVVIGV